MEVRIKQIELSRWEGPRAKTSWWDSLTATTGEVTTIVSSRIMAHSIRIISIIIEINKRLFKLKRMETRKESLYRFALE
jgi:hypothetical protein